MSIKQMSLNKFFSNLFKNVPYHAKNEFSRPNLIDNGSFTITERMVANPITFPKVIPTLATGTFITDRWEISGDLLDAIVSYGCNRVTENVPNTSLVTRFRNLNTNQTCSLRQYVYIPALEMRSRDYTVSFFMYSSKPIKCFAIRSHTDLTTTPKMIDYGVALSPDFVINASDTNTWKRFEWTIPKDVALNSLDPTVIGTMNGFTNITFTFRANHDEDTTIWMSGIKLEEGKYATKFEEMSYIEELNRCQALFYSSPSAVRVRAPGNISRFSAIVSYELPVTMKFRPLLTIKSPYADGGATVTSTTPSENKRNLVTIQCDMTNNYATGSALFFGYQADAEQWRTT